jgi:hypothetical protein
MSQSQTLTTSFSPTTAKGPPESVRGKRYCVTRRLETTERAYIDAQSETHARVLAERHWNDQEALGATVIPASESTNWAVQELRA